MLTLKTLATGSQQGNCYLLDNGKEVLILDCGIPIKDIKKGLNFDISRIVGVLCSHGHKDHSKALEDFRDMGIHIMAPFEIGDVKRSHCRMGSFDITSFDLPHNGVWNSGFLIKCDGQKILYMTDFEYCPYVFKKQEVNHILIECNYEQSLVNRDLPNFEHKIRGHCSLETCKNFIQANKTNALRTVMLCHLGTETCDRDTAIREVKEITGNYVFVDVAVAGHEYSLEKYPF